MGDRNFNSNQQGGGQGLPSGMNRQYGAHDTPHFSTTYEGFLVRRGLPLRTGEKGSWLDPQIESFSVTSKQLTEYKAKAKGYDWTTVYNALKSDHQRVACKRVLERQRSIELNRCAAWDYAIIVPKRDKIPGSWNYAPEIKAITVILKRSPKPGVESEMAYSQMPLTQLNVQNRTQDFNQRDNIRDSQRDLQRDIQRDLIRDNQRDFQKEHQRGDQRNNQGNNLPNARNQGGNNMPNPRNPESGSGHHGSHPPPPPPPGVHGPGPQHNAGGRGIQVVPNGQRQNPNTNMPMLPNNGNRGQQPGNPNRNSTESFNQRVNDWEVDSGYSDEPNMPGPVRNNQQRRPQGVPLPKPPPYPEPHSMAGGRSVGHIPNISPTPIMKKTSTSELVTTNIRGERERRVNKVVEDFTRPRRGSHSSGSSYDMVDDFSSRGSRSTAGTDTTYGSSEDQFRRGSKHQPRARRDSRYGSPRARSYSRDSGDRRSRRSGSNDRRRLDYRRESSRERFPKTKYREHRQPKPYRGTSPLRDSDSDIDRRPVINNYYIQGEGSVPRALSPGSSNASLYGSAPYRRRRAIGYPDTDPYTMNTLRTNLPPVAMAPLASPNPVEYQRQNQAIKQTELQAEAYMRAKENSARAIDAFNRGIKVGERKDSAVDSLWDDPIEQRHRRAAERDYDDLDWSDTYPASGSRRKGHRVTDDLLNRNYAPGAYGTSGARRSAYVDGQYGGTGYSMRGTRDSAWA